MIEAAAATPVGEGSGPFGLLIADINTRAAGGLELLGVAAQATFFRVGHRDHRFRQDREGRRGHQPAAVDYLTKPVLDDEPRMAVD